MADTSNDKPMVYELKITLRGAKPPIWRRVRVPAEATLAQFHDIVQVAVGWLDMHLHRFETLQYEAGNYGEPFGKTYLSERTARLPKVLPRVGSKLVYEYDFGDGWELDVVVEAIIPAEEGATYPMCVAGRRAGPPDDSGGVWGYMEKLEILEDRKHPEYKEIAEWIGEGFDSEAFDLAGINKALAKLGTRSRRAR